MYSYAELDEKWERKMKRGLVKPMFDLNKPPKKKKKKKQKKKKTKHSSAQTCSCSSIEDAVPA